MENPKLNDSLNTLLNPLLKLGKQIEAITNTKYNFCNSLINTIEYLHPDFEGDYKNLTYIIRWDVGFSTKIKDGVMFIHIRSKNKVSDYIPITDFLIIENIKEEFGEYF